MHLFFQCLLELAPVYQQVVLAAGEPHSSNCQHLMDARECLTRAIIAKQIISIGEAVTEYLVPKVIVGNVKGFIRPLIDNAYI